MIKTKTLQSVAFQRGFLRSDCFITTILLYVLLHIMHFFASAIKCAIRPQAYFSILFYKVLFNLLLSQFFKNLSSLMYWTKLIKFFLKFSSNCVIYSSSGLVSINNLMFSIIQYNVFYFSCEHYKRVNWTIKT